MLLSTLMVLVIGTNPEANHHLPGPRKQLKLLSLSRNYWKEFVFPSESPPVQDTQKMTGFLFPYMTIVLFELSRVVALTKVGGFGTRSCSK